VKRRQQPWIVIVEDNPTDVFMIREALDAHKIDSEVTVLEDGEAALEFVSGLGPGEECPDLLLLDINLPRVDGLRVLERLRDQCPAADFPVIVMTSSPAAADRIRSTDLGCDAYFQKPSGYDAFLAIGDLMLEQLSRRDR
jgi:chemotaxis family two-component system response regulator Rcp1